VHSTINRLVSFFPAEDQLQVRARLADNLAAIISLRLMPTKKQTARVPAVEIMTVTRSIQECIKDPSKTHEILDYIARGRGELMQTFDQHLLDLFVTQSVARLDLDLLLERIRKHDLPREAFEWFLDLRRYGTVPHSGFGLGLERCVGWIAGVEHVRECIPFPRTIYRVDP
jgi:hypothetical protein